MKITLLVILFSQFLFADIIGGRTVEKGEFNPVLKFSVGSYQYDLNTNTIINHTMKGSGNCSATRIAPKLILTAAHCFDKLIEFLAIKERRLGHRVPIYTDHPIQFKDPSVLVESYTPNPEYLKRMKQYFLKLDDLMTNLLEGKITKNDYSQKSKKLYSDSLKNILKYDQAVIRTKNTSDEFYEVSFNPIYEKEPVQFVGFGDEMTFHELEKSVKTLKGYNEELEKTQDSTLMEKLIPLIVELQVKIEKHKAGSPKKLGKNILHNSDWNQMYTTQGQAEQKLINDIGEYNMGASGDSGMGLLIEENGEIRVSGVFSFYSWDEYQYEGEDYIYNFFSSTALSENQEFLKNQLLR